MESSWKQRFVTISVDDCEYRTADLDLTSISFASGPIIVLRSFNGTYETKIHRNLLEGTEDINRALQGAVDSSGMQRVDIKGTETAIDCLVLWLYFQRLPYEQVEIAQLKRPDAATAGTTIIEAYNLARNLGLEEWSNRLVDLFTAFDSKELPLVKHYEDDIDDYDPAKCKMGQLIMTMVAFRLLRAGSMRYESLKQFLACKKYPASLLSLIQQVAFLGYKTMGDVLEKDRCVWHEHHITERCSAEDAPVG